jgi:N-dimethylarginine dimethylaminohydrolase
MSTTHVELTTNVLLTKSASAKQASFLMCPPNLYDVNYVINPWMAGNIHNSSQPRAAAQWRNLYDAVGRVANIELIEPEPGSPDMVFTANAGLERDGVVAISSFFHSERQSEEPHFRRWFRQAGYTVVDIPRTTPFEGEGDALFSIDGRCLWVGHGPRTAAASHRTLSDTWHIPVIPLHLIDPRFYHLDTCFAPLGGGYVMYFPDAFDHLSLHRIEAFYSPEKRIVVREADAVSFACNAINVGRTIIVNKITAKLSTQLEQLGFKVIEIELTEFLKAGGAAKCLVMKLSPPPHGQH